MTCSVSGPMVHSGSLWVGPQAATSARLGCTSGADGFVAAVCRPGSIALTRQEPCGHTPSSALDIALAWSLRLRIGLIRFWGTVQFSLPAEEECES